MKNQINNTNEKKLLSLYATNYAINYLRCVAVEAEMEQVAYQVYINGCDFYLSKLQNLNQKYNKLMSELFYHKKKLEMIA